MWPSGTSACTGVEGIEAARQIVASGSPCRVLMVTTFDPDEYAVTGPAHGAVRIGTHPGWIGAGSS